MFFVIESPISLSCAVCSVATTTEYSVFAGVSVSTFTFEATNSSIKVSYCTARRASLSLESMNGECLVGEGDSCQLRSFRFVDGMDVTYFFDESNGVSVVQIPKITIPFPR